jgi:hypothetical protein
LKVLVKLISFKRGKMDKRGQVKTKIIAGIVTVSIIALLIIAGPVSAFFLDLDLDDNSVPQGANAEFMATASFEVGDTLNVSYFILDLSGPVSISCAFMPDGTPITSCNGITIEKVHDPSQGSGYGYGYGGITGNYTYRIILDTTSYPLGTYETELFALTTQGIISFGGDDLTIYKELATLKRCSVRADEGEMEVMGEYFGIDNEFSYYHPQSGNDLGQGHLTGQYRGERFSYKFKTENIIDNAPDMLIIEVIGKYKLQTGPFTNDVSAILYIDKLHNMVNVVSDNFSLDNADIDFITGCD